MGLHSPVKFLLVDDTAENLHALEALLARDELEIYKAHSGQEALELLLIHDFALALLDIQMPDMDGFEVAELMRATERTRRVPIIFITAVATDEWRRFRGYEAGAVDYLFKPVDPRILTNKANVFFELARQKQELALQRDELRSTTQRLAKALERIQAHGDNSPLAIVEFDPNLRVISWSRGATRLFGWSEGEIVGRLAADLNWISGEDFAEFASVIADLTSGRRERNAHVHRTYSKTGVPIDCEWYSSLLFDTTGKLVSINAQLLDITERKRAEEIQQLLVGELNHRVKNMLATVQAVAKQSLRHAKDSSDFTSNFSDRIQALANAHSLLSNSTWQGAELADLIRAQIKIGTMDEERMVVSGPQVRLPAELALHLGLVLHELGTNANKYGALSAEHGRVTISWKVDDGFLQLRWVESEARNIHAPAKKGFGTTLIERSAQAEGGVARASYRSDGVTWEISFRLSGDHQPDIAAKAFKPAAQGRPRSVSASPDQLSGQRFLIIEDEPLVALELASVLEDAGVTIVGTVATVEKALESISTEELDGVLLDGNLRGQSVEPIAQALASHNVPFLFVTGYGRESLPSSFTDADILPKPFSPHQLLEAAGRLIQVPTRVFG